MKQSEKDGSRKPQSGRVSTRMEGTLSQGCEAASTGWAVVMVGGGSPQGLLSTYPRDITLVAKTHPPQGSLELASVQDSSSYSFT